MKIDKVLFGCNADPIYYEFWHPISRLFREVFDIHPVLLFVGDVKIMHQLNLFNDYGTAMSISVVPNVPEYLQATWARFYFANRWPDEVCLTGEIDRFPLSREWLVDVIADVDSEAYVHLNADGYRPGDFNFWKTHEIGHSVPAYNHVAKGNVFDKVYRFLPTWEEEIRRFAKTEGGTTHYDRPAWTRWCADEVYSTPLLWKYCEDGGLVVTPDYPKGRGINRPNFTYDVQRVKNGYYLYCHSIRPYSRHKEQIDALLKLVK